MAFGYIFGGVFGCFADIYADTVYNAVHYGCAVNSCWGEGLAPGEMKKIHAEARQNREENENDKIMDFGMIQFLYPQEKKLPLVKLMHIKKIK